MVDQGFIYGGHLWWIGVHLWWIRVSYMGFTYGGSGFIYGGSGFHLFQTEFLWHNGCGSSRRGLWSRGCLRRRGTCRHALLLLYPVFAHACMTPILWGSLLVEYFGPRASCCVSLLWLYPVALALCTLFGVKSLFPPRQGRGVHPRPLRSPGRCTCWGKPCWSDVYYYKRKELVVHTTDEEVERA